MEVLKLHEIKPEATDRDIELFFCTQLTSLAKNRSDFDLTEDWPSPSDIKVLCKKAAGFFIYALTVVKIVGSEVGTPSERLSLITSLPQSTANEGESGVDELYTQALQLSSQAKTSNIFNSGLWWGQYCSSSLPSQLRTCQTFWDAAHSTSEMPFGLFILSLCQGA